MMNCINPSSIAAPFARYSHGVSVSGMREMLTTSGQLGIRADGTIPLTASEQAAQCFLNIDAILTAASLDSKHVVKINAYVTDRIHMASYMKARDAWLADIPQPPASTLVIVSGFTRPEFLVEVEVLAVKY